MNSSDIFVVVMLFVSMAFGIGFVAYSMNEEQAFCQEKVGLDEYYSYESLSNDKYVNCCYFEIVKHHEVFEKRKICEGFEGSYKK